MEKKISLAVGLHPLMWDFFPFWKYTKKGLIGVFWGKETTSLNGKCLESPPHFFDSFSRWQKRKETFKEFQIPYNRHLLLSGKVQVPGQGRWTEQLLHLQDLNFNHIYTTIPRWSPVEGFPQVCCSCSRPTDGTPAPPPPPSSSRSAYCLRWTKLHFCLFLRRGHQQALWGEQMMSFSWQPF